MKVLELIDYNRKRDGGPVFFLFSIPEENRTEDYLKIHAPALLEELKKNPNYRKYLLEEEVLEVIEERKDQKEENIAVVSDDNDASSDSKEFPQENSQKPILEINAGSFDMKHSRYKKEFEFIYYSCGEDGSINIPKDVILELYQSEVNRISDILSTKIFLYFAQDGSIVIDENETNRQIDLIEQNLPLFIFRYVKYGECYRRFNENGVISYRQIDVDMVKNYETNLDYSITIVKKSLDENPVNLGPFEYMTYMSNKMHNKGFRIGTLSKGSSSIVFAKRLEEIIN